GENGRHGRERSEKVLRPPLRGCRPSRRRGAQAGSESRKTFDGERGRHGRERSEKVLRTSSTIGLTTPLTLQTRRVGQVLLQAQDRGVEIAELFDAAEKLGGGELQGQSAVRALGGRLLDFLPAEGRGDGGLCLGAERVDADRGLGRIILAPVD